MHHNYELIKYGGIIVFGLSLAIFTKASWISLIAVLIIAVGMIKYHYHHSLNSHNNAPTTRINRMQRFH
jgi:hypothetical protein